jgi:tRNA U34 2-thiouridine synthase MnmA/TrmU
MKRSEIKAIGLLSGGLDSTLALTLMHRLGYQVVVYHYANGLHPAIHVPGGPAKPGISRTAERLGVPVRVIDNSREVLQVVKHPDHGFGKNTNPCIDCRILMFRMTKARMKEEGASFIFDGEVVGQRPMSQRRQAMAMIDQAADVVGYVVRPLCGKLLPPTVPEQEGLISREDLLDISGRGRLRQMALAKEWNIGEYESPAGGCLLTDPGFSMRVRDELRFADPDVHEVQLLKAGRHFRLSERSKAILGRNAADCELLLALLAPDDLVIEARDMPGPVATIRGEVTPEAVRQAAGLVLRYAKAEAGQEYPVIVRRQDGTPVEELSLAPLSEEQAAHYLIALEGGCGGYLQTKGKQGRKFQR